MEKSKVIIVGGGFGGLNATKSLKKASVDLLLLDKSNHHLFQPLLYQVATAALSPGNIAVPIREVLAKQGNATVMLADIVKIDKEKRSDRQQWRSIFFDYLILAPGANHSYFGHPDWEIFAPGLKTLYDAVTIRERVLLSYERAERCENLEETKKFMRFVIVGGGPTGVEMAGAIAEIAHKSLVRNFRKIKPEQTKVFLIEGADQVLPSYPKSLAEKAKRDLEKLGVDVILNTLVTDVNNDGVWIGDKFLEASTIIWAAGNEASPLLKSLEVPLDRYGRVQVNPDLSISGYPDIFIIGDAACFKDKNNQPLPGIAPVAIQQGRYVAKLIRDQVPPKKRKPFVYFDKGMMATIGKAKAVAKIGKLKISGYFAWLAWCMIHILYLISFSNRALVMFQWFYLYLANQRRIRLITRPISETNAPLHHQHKNSIDPDQLIKHD